MLAILSIVVSIALGHEIEISPNVKNYVSTLVSVEQTASDIRTTFRFLVTDLEIWEKDLEAVMEEYKSLASEKQGRMREWEKIFQEASREQNLMRSALVAYKESIKRAMTEIENTRRNAKEVLNHKAVLERNIQKLRDFVGR